MTSAAVRIPMPESGEVARSKAWTESTQVSVVVCTADRSDRLRDCLAGLARQDAAVSYEVIVVDNSRHTDLSECVRITEQTLGHVQWVLVREPVSGLSRARNAGIQAARAPIVAFIDDDAVPCRDWVGAIADSFQRESVWAAGGPIKLTPEGPIPPWLPHEFLSPLGWLDYGPSARSLLSDERLAGGNLAARRDRLLAVGGFDHALGRIDGVLLSGEEVDLLERFRKVGGDLWYCPRALIYHAVPPERLRIGYFLRRYYWQGRTNCRSRGVLDPSRRAAHLALDLSRAGLCGLRALGWLSAGKPTAAAVWSARAASLVGSAVEALDLPSPGKSR